MDILSITILLAVVGTLNVVCFFVGAKVGQTIAKGEKVQAPTFNSVKTARAKQNNKEVWRKLDYYETISQNIDNYDGTSNGQKDVPSI